MPLPDMTQGQKAVQDLTAGMIVVDMGERIFNPEMPKAKNRAFFQYTKAIGKHKTVKQVEYQEVDNALLPRELAVNTVTSAANANPVTFTLASGMAKRILPRSLLRNLKTDETIFVQTVNTATDTIVAERVFEDKTAVVPNLTAADVLRFLYVAHPAGGVSDEAISTNPEINANFCSFLRKSVETTEHLKNTETYIEQEWNRIRQEGLIEHLWDIETAIFLSVRSNTVSGPGAIVDPVTGTKYTWSTGGIMQHMTGNVFDISGAPYSGVLSERAMDDFGEKASQNGSDKKTMFCGTHMISAMTQAAKNRLVLNDGIKKRYGITVLEYQTSCGLVIDFVPHPKMFMGYGATSGATGGTLADRGTLIDFEFVDYVTMENMSTKLWAHIEPNDMSGQKDEWRTVLGVRMCPGIGSSINQPTTDTQYLSPHAIMIGFDTYS